MPLPLITASAACVAALAASVAVHRVRGSTAVPAAWWAVVACLALAADACGQWRGESPAAAAAIRLGVSALAFCPAMSLLGAKRPQHGVWQLIVATLAVVIALPAISAWLVRPGSLPDVHPLGRMFLVMLAAAGWFNFVATSRGLVATAITAGQIAIVRPYLPGIDTAAAMPQPVLDAVGACLIAIGALAALVPRSKGTQGDDSIRGMITPPFLALRDTLGAAWSLRIAERFAAVSAERGWPCRLHFSGLEAGGDPADDSWHRDALRAFKALMRRFVDDAWLIRHGWREPRP